MTKKNILVKSMLVALLFNGFSPVLNAATVNELQDSVDKTNSQIAASDKEIAAKKSEIQDLTDSVDKMEKDLEAKRDQITENQKQLEKVEKEISKKEDEIKKLQKEYEVRKKQSENILSSMQKNSNVNYLLEMMSDDDMDTKSKLTAAHGLNLLASDSYDMILQTIELQGQVKSSKDELVVKQSELETEQANLASESDELVAASQEQAKQKEQIMQEVTEMSNANESQKKELLSEANLLEEYKNSGCSGNDVYGVDCAVPIETTTEEETTEEATTETSKIKKIASIKAKDTTTEESTTEESTTEESTTKEATTEEATTEEATTKEVTTEEVTTEEATTKKVTTEEATTKEVTTEEATTKEVTTEEATTEEATTEEVTDSTSGGSYYAKLLADPNASYIIQKESGWNPYSTNASSGAYGLCQAKPASKMASAGSDWATNPETQAKWCNSYAMERYGSWAAARAFWDANQYW